MGSFKLVFYKYGGSMKKHIFSLLIALFMLNAVGFAAAPGWKIDKALRFQLAYVPDGKVETGKQTEMPKSLGYTSDYTPDIDNINLADIKGLGFNLPDRADARSYKLYLKLYNFPVMLRPRATAIPIIREFHLDKVTGGKDIMRFAGVRENLAVKYAFIDKADRQFTAENPFPPLTVSGGGEFAAKFNDAVLFCSLYLNPEGKPEGKSADELASASAQGVVAFHRNLLLYYRTALKPANGPDSDKYEYFNAGDGKSVLKIPKTPLVFSNWRDLPMPSNPNKHFLSGLLLIYLMRSDAAGVLVPQTVFEVGSIVRQP